jgi:hypothetical protein
MDRHPEYLLAAKEILEDDAVGAKKASRPALPLNHK